MTSRWQGDDPGDFTPIATGYPRARRKHCKADWALTSNLRCDCQPMAEGTYATKTINR